MQILRAATLFLLLGCTCAYAAPNSTPAPMDIPASESSDDADEPPALPAPADKHGKEKKSDTIDEQTLPPAEPAPESNSALLQGLNKVTGRASTLEVWLGEETRFGNLEIVVRRCWKSPPDAQPENAALLEISEVKTGEPPEQIFLGWMFSSSPGLSSLEHPVYDVTVLSCEHRKDPAEQIDAAPTATPAAKK